MKRGLRVKTGVRAPARIATASGLALAAWDESTQAAYDNRPTFPPIEDALAASMNMTSLVPLPGCANRTKSGDYCGACHYCRVRVDGPTYWTR